MEQGRRQDVHDHTESGSLWLGEEQLSRAQVDQSVQYRDASDLLSLTCSIPIHTHLHFTNPKGQCHRQWIYNTIIWLFLVHIPLKKISDISIHGTQISATAHWSEAHISPSSSLHQHEQPPRSQADGKVCSRNTEHGAHDESISCTTGRDPAAGHPRSLPGDGTSCVFWAWDGVKTAREDRVLFHCGTHLPWCSLHSQQNVKVKTQFLRE